MAVLDHVFICTTAGAPGAGRLVEFGLQEGRPNQHPGQGTACRRFFFRNAMLELLWVENAAEAQSQQTRQTLLWDRWSAAGQGVSPFGVILRPDPPTHAEIPFQSWEYRPSGMPDLILHIASGTELAEPMWCFSDYCRPPSEIEHPSGFREVTGAKIHCPALDRDCVTSAMARSGAISIEAGPQHLLELEFDGNQGGNRHEFLPGLPLIFRW